MSPVCAANHLQHGACSTAWSGRFGGDVSAGANGQTDRPIEEVRFCAGNTGVLSCVALPCLDLPKG